ncbi:WXG100 family type VII secretion target [Nocardioides sp. CFH 31398]|uniref:WXG100 family type VII secretion target n=1 Tax=Nocardioides sp. CFH 31398 TaxID=2919579 RepID=UPI001F06E97B|nr:WXG100 family type VII secretion target [Nocardioides sp. CFH 31398]MCH1869073.1 WXG100 family type VII secretion target [Nocardioides sp. CFH 31398]
MAQDIRLGEGRLKNAAGVVRDAQSKFDKDAGTLQQKIAGMASGWQGEGGNAFQGLAQAWQQRHQRITRVLGQLADALDETERDSVANDTDIGQGVATIARGLEA